MFGTSPFGRMDSVDGDAVLPAAAGLDFRYESADVIAPMRAALPDVRHLAMTTGSSALERARTARRETGR